MSHTIKLQTSDGKCFEVSREVANQMGTVRNLIESFEDDEDSNTVLPLPQVKGKILEPILKWCEYHKNDEILSVSDGMTKVRSDIEDPFDKEFVNVPNHQLFDYILTANYLAIENLLELTCKTVSDMIKGKTAKQIREQFELTDEINNEDVVHAAKRVAK